MNTEIVRNFPGSKVIGRLGLHIQKAKPEILVGVGIVAVIAAGVLACKATLKIDGALDDARQDISFEKRAERTPENENEKRRAIASAYFRFGKEVFKLYWPAVTVGALGIASIIYGHDVSRRRNVALMAAYTGLERTFNNYRQRVISAVGEEVEDRIRTGIEKREIEKTYTDDKGNEKTKREKIPYMDDPNKFSQYARFFDSGCRNWEDNPEYNLMFLRGQQSYFNDLLKVRGHVFLNEVYDALGIPRTGQGALVGWVVGAGDNFVDFGLYDVYSEKARDFVNGYEPTILLDFNVDGVIFDKI